MNQNIILQTIANESLPKKDMPDVQIGSKVKIHYTIIEGDKKRIQVYEGLVIGRHNNGVNSTVRVRKISFNIGVERVFPLYSPLIEKIEIVANHKVRRGKLFYLRGLQGKAGRLKIKESFFNKKN